MGSVHHDPDTCISLVMNIKERVIRAGLPGVFSLILLMVIITVAQQSIYAQGVNRFERESSYAMLAEVKEDVKKNYYDPNFRGMNLDARFAVAREGIKQAKSRDELIVTIAQVLLELNDSHTFFYPPFRAARISYGWKMQMIGDDCLVTEVNPKSDAATKGLKPGAVVLEVDGYRPMRDNIWKMNYRYYALMPASSIQLSIRNPGETQPRQIEVLSKIEKTEAVPFIYTNIYRYNSEIRYEEDKFYEQGDAIVWRLVGFDFDPDHVEHVIARLRKFKTLILDLRGNGGGYKVTLERLAGYFFDHDVKIGDLKGRKEIKPILAKSFSDKGFKGQLIVLVDSDSGSASELFARTIQLEKRGTVIGDLTAGAVMTSRAFDHKTGVGGTLYYGTSITIADVIMPDGMSLENSGVKPDIIMIPRVSDIAERRDPVLAHAAKVAGFELTPEKAGTLFPIEWSK